MSQERGGSARRFEKNQPIILPRERTKEGAQRGEGFEGTRRRTKPTTRRETTMASMAMHSCCSPLCTSTSRALSSSSTSTTSRTIAPGPGPMRRTSSSSSSIRVEHQQQSECSNEQMHLQRSTKGNKRGEDFQPSSTVSSVYYRREILYRGAAAAAVMGAQVVVGRAIAADDADSVMPATPPTKPITKDDKVDTTITDKVYLDLSICPNASRSDRTLGNTSQLCTIGEPLGRIVIGLYGRLVPQTVKNFKAMIAGTAGTSYAGTIVHRVLPGQYIQAGRQGSKEKGEVSGLLKLESNEETVSSKSYKLTHSRPGTVSLALAENDDDEVKLDVDYRNVQFLITTGPGPAPQLDNGNIVFGTVLEGLDVVAAVAKVPTYRPSDKIKQFNDFASFLGDERAANARNFWDRPLKTVVINACGEIPLGLPVFPPGLP